MTVVIDDGAGFYNWLHSRLAYLTQTGLSEGKTIAAEFGGRFKLVVEDLSSIPPVELSFLCHNPSNPM